MIGKVDAVLFVDGWQQARGCCIEHRVCEYYNIKILDENFLKPANANPLVKQI